MARVPIAQNLVQQAPATDAKFRAFDSGGEAIGAGIRDLGQSVAEFGRDRARIEGAHAEAGAKKLDIIAADWIRRELWDGPDAYYDKSGFDAVQARPGLIDRIERKRAELIGQATTPLMGRMFADAFDRRRQEALDGAARWEREQFGVEGRRQSVARMESFGLDAQRVADDSVALETNIAAGLNELRSQAGDWPPETLHVAERRFRSRVYADVVHGKLIDDIDAASAFFETYRHAMDFADVQAAEAVLALPLRERQAYADADRVMGLPPEPSGAGAVGDTASAAQLFDGIRALATPNGRQFGPDGKVWRSVEGAIGAAQLPAGSGPDAAALAGLPWNAETLEADEAYNVALGRAWFGKQLSDFGDPTLAAAAYHSGSDAARAAIAKAQEAGRPDEWRAYLSEATHAYVDRYTRIIDDPRVRQTPQRHDLDEILRRVDLIAEREGWTPERREAARAQLAARVRRDATLLDRQQADALGAALSHVDRLGDEFRSVAQIPAAILARLSPQQRVELDAVAAHNRAPQAITANGEAFATLNLMTAEARDKFVATDLRLYRTRMTPDEYALLVETQAALRANPRGAAAARYAAAWAEIARHGSALGIATGDGADAEDRDKASRLVTAMVDDLSRATAGQDRPPTPDEVTAAFDRAMFTCSCGTRGPGVPLLAGSAPLRATCRYPRASPVVRGHSDRADGLWMPYTGRRAAMHP